MYEIYIVCTIEKDIKLQIHAAIHPSIHPSILPPTHPSTHPSIHLFSFNMLKTELQIWWSFEHTRNYANFSIEYVVTPH